MFERIANSILIFPPWTKPSYSNLGFAILGTFICTTFVTLGRVIEKIVGMTYEQYVEEYILKPLNLQNTGFEYTTGVLDEMATGYSGSESFLRC